jgi:hypothetical protein
MPGGDEVSPGGFGARHGLVDVLDVPIEHLR